MRATGRARCGPWFNGRSPGATVERRDEGQRGRIALSNLLFARVVTRAMSRIAEYCLLRAAPAAHFHRYPPAVCRWRLTPDHPRLAIAPVFGISPSRVILSLPRSGIHAAQRDKAVNTLTFHQPFGTAARVIVGIAGAATLLAPYELLIRPGVPVFTPA